MKKKRILLVLRHPVGGIRTFFRYFYPKLPVDRYSFVLITPSMAETEVLANDLREIDVEFIRVESRIGLFTLVRKVMQVLRTERFDMVHSHGLTSAVAAVPGARLTSTFHLTTLHDVFTAKQFIGRKGMFFKSTIGIALSLVNRIHCVSHDAHDNLLEYMPVLRWFNSNKVVVVLNGINTEHFAEVIPRDLRQEFNLPTNSFLIGFLGRFMNQKGFAELVRAYELLLKQGSSLRIPKILCFSPEDGFIREERADINARGLSDQVLFLPFVADVGPTLRGLDVVAIPSRWEACPLLPMEVLASGVPLIGSDCVGLREVLTGTPARIFPTRDAEALALALRQELATPSVAQAKAYSAEAAKRFDVTQRVQELQALIECCLVEAGRGI